MEIKEIESFLTGVPLFSTLSLRERKAIGKIMVLREFKPKETIVHEEDSESHSFFTIVTGKVNVVVITSEGKETILATLNPGDFFGEMAVLDGEPRSASVVAADECSLLMLYRPTFIAMLQKYPQIAIQMLKVMSKRLRKANRQISTLSLMSVYGRVADVLLQLAQEYGKRYADMIIVHNRPTHQRIADMAGTSRETVSRILSQLQKKGYIKIDRNRLVILDEKKLYD
ncbi:MAG: cyclic nucleotide-binding domain-containing protein [Chitinivibrionales bacterium]|nr:cyclic nucleotide-binding domain-containing protein [Chitinivibrionales bacterium]